MIKKIIGGVIVLVIGGTSYSVSQSTVVDNFSKNSGKTQQQSQQYIDSIPKSDLQSFAKIGQDNVKKGNEILQDVSTIDCVNYTYPWETASLSCQEGLRQLTKLGNDEVALGNCYQALDTDLGSGAKSKISECILDIDTFRSDIDLPMIPAVYDSKTVTNAKDRGAYNKSILQAALESKQ